MADDAAKVAPHVYKVVFENERARVLEDTVFALCRERRPARRVSAAWRPRHRPLLPA